MIPEREFEILVEAALHKIPRRFLKRMKNVAVVVEQEPSAHLLHSSGVRRGGSLLGLYQGRPLTHRSVSDSFVMPDRIIIFQGPHERMATSKLELRRMVEDTVWHEVAHYFGLDERRVRSAERRRKRAE